MNKICIVSLFFICVLGIQTSLCQSTSIKHIEILLNYFRLDIFKLFIFKVIDFNPASLVIELGSFKNVSIKLK